MDIGECRRQGFIRKVPVNTAKARSLIEVAGIKEHTVKNVSIDAMSVNAYLPLAYDSLRETLEAFCILQGYQVTNHVCLGELVKEIWPGFDFASFDRFRYARNGINYYGRKVDREQGKEMIDKMFAMRKILLHEVQALLGKSRK